MQIATHHLLDHIEWDLLSPLTPEEFSQKLCTEIGLSGEAVPLIAHAIHEELIKHKKDAIEWGVIGGDRDRDTVDDHGERPKDKTGLGFVKDKTGLGLSWGRTPKDGRGPKALRGVWRDWAEAEEFRTRFEVLSAEEVERREVERERASRWVLWVCFLRIYLIFDLADGYGVRPRSFRRPGRGDGDGRRWARVPVVNVSCP